MSRGREVGAQGLGSGHNPTLLNLVWPPRQNPSTGGFDITLHMLTVSELVDVPIQSQHALHFLLQYLHITLCQPIRFHRRQVSAPPRRRRWVLIALDFVMATVSSWSPHPDLEVSFVPVIQKIIDSIPPAHLLPPRDREIYDAPSACFERLQNFAFSQGFAVVTGSCGRAGNPRKYYRCIHHGDKTRNWRRLEEHVRKESISETSSAQPSAQASAETSADEERKEEEPTTHQRHRENTKINCMGCKWSVSLSYKRIERRRPENQAWVLCVKEANLEHPTHQLLPNPLAYEAHRLRNPDYTRALDIAVALLALREGHTGCKRSGRQLSCGALYHSQGIVITGRYCQGITNERDTEFRI